MNLIFETPRLRCRRLVPEDLKALLEVYGDAHAMRWVDDGSPLTEADARAWLRGYREQLPQAGLRHVRPRGANNHQVVGFCGLVHPGGQPEAEVKYAFLRTYWGQGLATEAVRELLKYGADSHGLTHIVATVDPENLASQKVLAKVGMAKTELRENEDGSQAQVFEWRQ